MVMFIHLQKLATGLTSVIAWRWREIVITLAIALAVFVLIREVYALEPASYDITMQAGEDYRLQLQLKDSAGTPLNLSGVTYRAQFRAAPAPAGAIFASYSAIVTAPAAGSLEVRLSKAQTAVLSGKAGLWDLQQTDTAGQATYILRGKAIVQPTVTR